MNADREGRAFQYRIASGQAAANLDVVFNLPNRRMPILLEMLRTFARDPCYCGVVLEKVVGAL